MSIWDNPEINVLKKYVTFENIGDSVEGLVTEVSIQKWTDGTSAPKIVLDTDEGEKIITAGQVRLKIALIEKRPEVGDYLKVSLVSIEDRSEGKFLKHFVVDITKP